MRDQFGGAIFEGILAAVQTTGRGSAFGTDYVPYIPVYDPLNPANMMSLVSETTYEGEEPLSPSSP